jgi:glutaredoxin
MPELTLYTRAGCHLCEEAKQQLAPLVREFGLDYREVDVDSDRALAARFGEELPVVFLNDRKVAKYRVDVRMLRRRLDQEKIHRRDAPFGSAPTSRGSAQGREDAEKAQRRQ